MDSSQVWVSTAADRLTGRRCWTVLSAAAEARMLHHGRVGTEHLLLALLDEPACAALLAPFEVDRTAIRRAVAGLLGPDPHTPSATALAARTGEALLLARAEADRLGDADVHPVPLLLALLRQETGIPVSVLSALGADVREVVARARLHLDGERAEDPPPSLTWVRSLPDLRRFTAQTRRALADAAEAAAREPASARLLGPAELPLPCARNLAVVLGAVAGAAGLLLLIRRRPWSGRRVRSGLQRRRG